MLFSIQSHTYSKDYYDLSLRKGAQANPGPAFTILVTLQQMQILGLFLHGMSYRPTD